MLTLGDALARLDEGEALRFVVRASGAILAIEAEAGGVRVGCEVLNSPERGAAFETEIAALAVSLICSASTAARRSPR